MGMSDSKILGVLARYEKKVIDLLGNEAWEEHNQLMHAQEMIPKMRKFLEEKRREKVFRWLGFIQGILYCNGIYSIEEMADHNRPTKAEVREQNPGHSLDRYTPCGTCGDMEGCHLWRDLRDAPADG